mgnify:CR=1 FL=1
MRIKKKGAIRILLLVSGSLMLIYGIFRNEVTYVFFHYLKKILKMGCFKYYLREIYGSSDVLWGRKVEEWVEKIC